MKQKGAPEPAPVPDPPATIDPGWDPAGDRPPILDFGEPVTVPQTAPQSSARRVAASAGAEPASIDDAMEQILRAARFLRREMPLSPVPYLVVRALRWGELRANGSYADQSQFEAPATEIRVELKRLANEGLWDAVREAAENAAGQPCGRAWLDVQRYAATACRNNGLEAPAVAILSGVKALLADYPDLPNWVLVDDTPVANSETRQWLESEGLLAVSHPAAEPAAEPPPPMWTYTPEPVQQPQPGADCVEAPPDAFDLARDAAQSGRFQEAVSILSVEIAHESSARARFLRKTQLAQICLAAGQPEIGRPILQQLSLEIGERGLEQWENGETLSQPLALLYQCMNGDETAARQELYGRICRLDPPRALGLQR
jgi:type VI secretion system protein ImpA